VKLIRLAAVSAALLILAGCSSVDMAPIEDRTGTYETTQSKAQTIALGSGSSVKAERRYLVADRSPVDSGRVHVVREGDTLYNIGVRYGVNPRELQSLNQVKDPSALAIGQTLKIPATAKREQAATQPAATSKAAHGVASAAPATVVLPQNIPSQGEPTVERAKRPETPEQTAQRKIAEQAAARDAAARGEMHFRWPAKGDVVATFKETKMGIDIAGKLGDPVYAVLDGTVQYVGSNTPGYGNFLIIRHNVRLPGKGNMPLITVYGNTSKILVRVNENVRAGQQVAEMGKSDAPRVKLRFEVRQGKPLDPIPYLSD